MKKVSSEFRFDHVTEHLGFMTGKDFHHGAPLKDASPQKVAAKMKNFLAKYNSANHRVELELQRYGDSYLHANFEAGYLSGGRIEYVRLFSIVAVFILLIACINFMNLTIARSAWRAREIGIRKVLGADVVSLFTLLSKEFVVLVIIAFFIASPLAWWVMNKWLQGFLYKIDIEWWMFVLVVLLITGIALLTICYQTMKTILMNPVKSLKGE